MLYTLHHGERRNAISHTRAGQHQCTMIKPSSSISDGPQHSGHRTLLLDHEIECGACVRRSQRLDGRASHFEPRPHASRHSLRAAAAPNHKHAHRNVEQLEHRQALRCQLTELGRCKQEARLWQQQHGTFEGNAVYSEPPGCIGVNGCLTHTGRPERIMPTNARRAIGNRREAGLLTNPATMPAQSHSAGAGARGRGHYAKSHRRTTRTRRRGHYHVFWPMDEC